jgi:ubiquinone/menaquinone biosynthesis C-methylase UbiE
MLPRVLEPEVMDSPEEARDYDAMDHAQVNRAFVADFLAIWPGVGPVLDVGTGTAQIPIELCGHSPNVTVVGIDLAAQMLSVGRDNLRRAGLEKRIQLEWVDAKQLPYPAGAYAAVISNSIVHHIPQPQKVMAEMVRVTAPGGILFVRDLLRPDNDVAVGRLVTAYAGAANPQQRQMFEASLRAALTLEEIRAQVALLGFDAKAVNQTTDRHWTWQASKPRAMHA